MGTLKITRVVLDTNVLVSGLLFGGNPGKVLDLGKTGAIRLMMSRVMLDEFLRVLAYPKLRLSEEEIQYLLYVEVLPHVDMVAVPPGPVLALTDPADEMFVHYAVASGANHIISGDRHLLQLKSIKRIHILTPAEFLSRISD